MSEIRDNDFHAFPTSTVDGFTQHGMMLRDYFAGQALAGYFAAPYSGHRNCGREEAKYIWSMADAMMATRPTTSPNKQPVLPAPALGDDLPW